MISLWWSKLNRRDRANSNLCKIYRTQSVFAPHFSVKHLIFDSYTKCRHTLHTVLPREIRKLCQEWNTFLETYFLVLNQALTCPDSRPFTENRGHSWTGYILIITRFWSLHAHAHAHGLLFDDESYQPRLPVTATYTTPTNRKSTHGCIVTVILLNLLWTDSKKKFNPKSD